MTTEREARADLFATIRAAAAADGPCTLTYQQVHTLQKTLVSVLDLLNEYRDRAQHIPPASSGAGGDYDPTTQLFDDPFRHVDPTTPEPRDCPTPGAVTDSYPVGPAWVEAEQSMRLQNPPDGLYVVRNGIAVAVTEAAIFRAIKRINPYAIRREGTLAAALSRPADGAAE